MQISKCVGIDLGTTSSVIAMMADDNSTIVCCTDRTGCRTFPSAIIPLSTFSPEEGETYEPVRSLACAADTERQGNGHACQNAERGLPGPAQFLQMLSRIAVMFCLLIGFALGCLKNKTPHPSLWKYVLTQACLLLAPFTFYKILEFFGRLPVPIWGIVLYVLYGILYVILSLVAALIIISDV